MNGRVFDGRLAGEIAPDDRARRERLKATARALVAAVRDGLVRDGIVRLHGFGTFRLKPVAARTGRHPRTGEPIDIPAGWRVMFRPAKALRERVEPERGASLPIGERPVTRGHDTSGAIAAAREAADRLPGEDASAGVAGVERSRAAAAAIPESKVSVRGPVPPTKEELEADSRVTRSSAALMRAPVANEPASTAGPAAAEESVAATEEGVAATEPGRSRYRTAPVLLLLLLLLAIGLAWLFWPAGPPQAPLATGPEPNGTTTSVRTDDGAAGATGGTDTVAAEDGTTAVADGAEADAGAGDPDNASVRGDDTAAADSTPTAADDTEAPTADAGTTSDDGALTVLSEAAGRETAEGATATGDAAPAASADESASAAGRAGTTPTDVTGAGSGETAAATTTGGSGTVATSSTDGAAGADGGQAVDSGTLATSAGGTDTADTGTGTDTGTAVADPYFDGRDHTVRAGDTLWGLADRHYVNPFYWPHIWNHNGAIADPDRLEVRQGIWLPTLEGEPRALTAADRRSIAEGYLRLYRLFRSRGNANPEYALVGVRYFDVSVLPARLRDTSAGRPSDTLAAAFQAQLEAEFPLD